MKKTTSIGPMGKATIALGNFRFECDDVVDGVPVNPVLPENFSDKRNEDRPDRHMVWWDIPYIETYTDDHPEFVKAWSGSIRFDVRCLDGGAWDRPTCWGMFATLDEAVAQAKKQKAVWLE